MKPKGWASLAALCVVLTGCSRIEEVFMSAPAKVNAAYPVSPEVRLAQERLGSLLGDDAKALAELKGVSDAQLTIRALACSKGHVIARFDSVESIKGLSLERTCFQDQDQELLKLYGIRTVGALLARPALKPKQDLGPAGMVPAGKLSAVSGGVVAADANVAVFVDGQGQGIVVDLEENKTMAELPRLGSISPDGLHISPNGRIVALTTSGRAPVFMDAETGHQIWAPAGNGGQRLLAWLPEVTGWVMTTQDGSVMLADGLKGTLERHPQSIKNASHAANIPGQSPGLLLGTSRDFALVSHARAADGIKATTVKQYSLSPRGISSGQPMPMKNGKMVVFLSYPELGWLDLESGENGSWHTSPMFYMAPVKLDEQHLLMDSGALPNRPSLTWRFNIETEVITQVGDGVRKGSLHSLGARAGFLRRGSESWMGDDVEATADGVSQPMSQAVADHELQIQLAKLESAGRAAEAEENRAAMLDRLERGTALRPMTSSAAGLEGVAKDAEVHMVGVHGGRQANMPASSTKQPVRVMVRQTSRPVILVLASHDPVNWLVFGAEARIAAVLMSGEGASALGTSLRVPVVRIGSVSAHSSGSSEYLRLRQAVTQHTGSREIKSFQGAYNGSEFTVGEAR